MTWIFRRRLIRIHAHGWRTVVAEATEAPETKLTSTKRRWAADGKFLTGRIARPETDRLPPGQHLVKDWPILDLGQQPHLTHETWRLDITGLVENPLSLDWTAFQALPQTDSQSDIHCVTTWSRYDNRWRGVHTRDLLDRAMPKPEAVYVMLTSYDGYSTNLPLADFAAEDAILATAWEGEPISRAHGGPMRLVVPHLYFWKSAKWLQRIDFRAADFAGFWERNGYHMRGDPWLEERYSGD
nr:sulfite oxidase-like oxidoreductase [Sinorhizobium medicae]